MVKISTDNSIVRASISLPNDGLIQTRGAVGIFHSVEKNVKSYTDLNDQPGLGENLHYHETDKSLMLMPDSIAGNFTDMNTGWKDIIGTTRDVFPMNPAWCGSCKTSSTEWGGAHKTSMKIESIEQYDANRVFEFTQFNSPIDIGNHHNSVSKYLASTGALVDSYLVGDTPTYIAYDAVDGIIWTANYMSHTVSKIEKSSGNILGTYKAGWNPTCIAINTTHIFVTNEGSNSVTQLTKLGVFVKAFPAGFKPQSVAVDATNIWVTNKNDNTVSKINISTGVVTSIQVGIKPVCVIKAGTDFWIANSGSNTVSKYNAGGTLVITIPVGRTPSALLWDGALLWVANKDDNTVSVVNGSSVSNTYYTGFNPVSLALDGSSVWIANYGANKVIKMSSTGVISTQITSEYCPSSIVFDGTNIWVNNSPMRKCTFLQLDIGVQVDSRGKTIDGSGYRLEWISDQYPMFWSPEDPVTKTRQALSRYTIRAEDVLTYINGGAVKWTLMPTITGEMVIFSTALGERWVIQGLQNSKNLSCPLGIPKGKVSIMVDGVASSVNFHAVTYPEFGICKSGWVNLNDFDIMSKSVDKFLTMCYPYTPGINIQLAGAVYLGLGEREFVPPAEAITPNIEVKNRVKVYILIKSGGYDATKGYGIRTPVLRGWQVLAPPEFEAPEVMPTSLDISSFIKDCAITLNTDVSTNTVAMTLENNRYWKDYSETPDNNLTLMEGILSSGLSMNRMSCEVEYGYEVANPVLGVHNANTRKFKGIIPASAWSANMGKDTYSITVKSPAQQCLQTEMYNAPCLIGFAIDEAIATVATWTGIPTSKIFIHAQESQYARWKKQGSRKSVLILPSAPGDITEGTPVGGATDWQAISDGDYANSYVMQQSAQSGFTDTYYLNFSSVPEGMHINNITVSCTFSGNTYAQAVLRMGGKNYTKLAGYAGDTSATGFAVWDKNPETGKCWTTDDLEGLQAGIILDNSADDVKCYELFVTVDYLDAGLDLWGRSLVDTPDMEWTYVGDDIAINYYLAGDMFNMDSPEWLNNQQRGWEVMAKIADKFGYVLYFEGDNLHIARLRKQFPVPLEGQFPTIEFIYDGVPVLENNTFKLRELSLTPAEREICNVVVFEGEDGNGNPMMSCDIDYASINNPADVNYIGYRLSHRNIDKDVKTQRGLNTITRNYMSSHRAGALSMSGATIFKEGWWVIPNMVFYLNTNNLATMGRDIFRVKSVTLNTGIDTVWTISITAEDIDMRTPYAYSLIGSKSAFTAIRYLIDGMRPLSASLQAPDNSGNAVFIRDPKHLDKYRFTIGDVFGGGVGGNDCL